MKIVKANVIATAYHEAGHAVVAHYLNVSILRAGLSIRPDETTSGRAHISNALGGNPEWSDSGRARLRAEKLVLVLLAGMEAQRKYNARTVRSYHGHSDYRNAVDVLSYFVGSNEELEAYLKWLVVRAQQIVANPAIWIRIQAVATALVE